MKRILVVSVLLLIMGVTLAYAQDIITGSGVFTADGSGIFAMNGAGEVTVEGTGMLFIVDRTHTATIHISTIRRTTLQELQTRGNKVQVYRQFHGTAHIVGTDVAVVMEGIMINVSVSGTGMVMLEGEGNYVLNNVSSTWSDDGVLIDLSSLYDDK